MVLEDREQHAHRPGEAVTVVGEKGLLLIALW
jgi:hypothetical protein